MDSRKCDFCEPETPLDEQIGIICEKCLSEKFELVTEEEE